MSMWPFKTKTNRNIFKFYDGMKYRAVDPMVVTRGLEDHPEFLFDKHWIGVTQGNTKDIGIVAKAVRDVFEIKPLDNNGKGLTESECINLFVAFHNYCEGLKKNIETPPTLPQSLDPASNLDNETITNTNLDSGSISIEPCNVEPGSSNAELATP